MQRCLHGMIVVGWRRQTNAYKRSGPSVQRPLLSVVWGRNRSRTSEHVESIEKTHSGSLFADSSCISEDDQSWKAEKRLVRNNSFTFARTHTHAPSPATVVGLLSSLAEEEVPLTLRVWQVGLQPALVALGQWTARYAVMGSETTSHMAWAVTTRSWTFPVAKTDAHLL